MALAIQLSLQICGHDKVGLLPNVYHCEAMCRIYYVA